MADSLESKVQTDATAETARSHHSPLSSYKDQPLDFSTEEVSSNDAGPAFRGKPRLMHPGRQIFDDPKGQLHCSPGKTDLKSLVDSGCCSNLADSGTYDDQTDSVELIKVRQEATLSPDTPAEELKKQERTQQEEVQGGEAAVTDEDADAAAIAAAASHQTAAGMLAKKFVTFLTAMFSYSKSGDVKALIAPMRSLMAAQDNAGDTPLHTAIINCQQSVAYQFIVVLAAKPDGLAVLNSKNSKGQTALMLAILTCQPNVVDWLLKARVDPGVVDSNGNNALHLAIRKFRPGCKCLRLLLDNPSTSGRPDGPSIPALYHYNDDGHAPIHLAVTSGRLATLQLLLKADREVAELPDRSTGKRPIHYAVQGELLPMVGELLLKSNVDVDAPMFDGNTPLHLAVMNKNYNMVALLMSAGADPNELNYDAEEEDSDAEAEEDEAAAEEPALSGTSSFDLAFGDDKMQCILNGETSASVRSGDSLPDSDVTSGSFDDGPPPSTHHSSLASQPSGDVQDLSLGSRYKIGELLDANPSKLEEVAQHLGMRSLMRGLQTADSPGRALLDCYEALGGTMTELEQTFGRLGLYPAADQVKKCLKKNETVCANPAVLHKAKLQPPDQDSGFLSGSLDHSSSLRQ